MFFMVGLGPRIKDIGPRHGKCPACGHGDTLYITRHSQAVRVFFVPVFHFGAEYLATCPNCASVMELAPDVGKLATNEPHFSIRAAHLRILQNNTRSICPVCGCRARGSDERFCSRCGAGF